MILCNSFPRIPFTPCLFKHNRVNPLQVLAVVDGGGDGDSLGGSRAGGDGRGDAPARASRGVLHGVVARRSVGGDVGGELSLSAELKTVGTLELGGLVGVDGDGDGGGTASCE